MTIGIILAGGSATRLGPLAARGKALLPVGQRPHLVRQVEQLVAVGCDEIVVVANPQTVHDVAAVSERAGLNLIIATQPSPHGPVDAIKRGLQRIPAARLKSEDVYVLMSDTLLNEPLPLADGVSWVGVAKTPVGRNFCFWDHHAKRFIDGAVAPGAEVTIGAYYFARADLALDRASLVVFEASTSSQPRSREEVGMAPFLSRYFDHNPRFTGFASWQDIGDLDALTRTAQSRFIARAHHRFDLGPTGILTKSGSDSRFRLQRAWLRHHLPTRSVEAQNLFPRTYFTDEKSLEYGIEFIDLPTLAELWLYHPGQASVWISIMTNITEQLSDWLWSDSVDFPDPVAAEHAWFIAKTLNRVEEWNPELVQEVAPLLDAVTPLFTGSVGVRGHGDLNFTNILYSVRTGVVKLLDPRGDPTKIPLSYELAKLRYSYNGGFAAITHGLYDFYYDGSEQPAAVDLWPQRAIESEALDTVLGRFESLAKLTAAEGCLLLAATPLHEPTEALALYLRGVELLREAASATA